MGLALTSAPEPSRAVIIVTHLAAVLWRVYLGGVVNVVPQTVYFYKPHTDLVHFVLAVLLLYFPYPSLWIPWLHLFVWRIVVGAGVFPEMQARGLWMTLLFSMACVPEIAFAAGIVPRGDMITGHVTYESLCAMVVAGHLACLVAWQFAAGRYTGHSSIVYGRTLADYYPSRKTIIIAEMITILACLADMAVYFAGKQKNHTWLVGIALLSLDFVYTWRYAIFPIRHYTGFMHMNFDVSLS